MWLWPFHNVNHEMMRVQHSGHWYINAVDFMVLEKRLISSRLTRMSRYDRGISADIFESWLKSKMCTGIQRSGTSVLHQNSFISVQEYLNLLNFKDLILLKKSVDRFKCDFGPIFLPMKDSTFSLLSRRLHNPSILMSLNQMNTHTHTLLYLRPALIRNNIYTLSALSFNSVLQECVWHRVFCWEVLQNCFQLISGSGLNDVQNSAPGVSLLLWSHPISAIT